MTADYSLDAPRANNYTVTTGTSGARNLLRLIPRPPLVRRRLSGRSRDSGAAMLSLPQQLERTDTFVD